MQCPYPHPHCAPRGILVTQSRTDPNETPDTMKSVEWLLLPPDALISTDENILKGHV